MNILVTGGSGFLGREIVKQLLVKGYKVYSLQRKFSNDLEKLGVVQYLFDASDESTFDQLLKENIHFEVIFHTAAKAGIWGDISEYERANVLATKNLLSFSQKNGTKYLIYTSTPSVVYGKTAVEFGDENMPYAKEFLTYYAKTKAEAEKDVLHAHSHQLQTIAIRPHLIFGRGDPHLVPRIIERAKKNKLFQVGNGQNLVDVIHVKNAAFAHLCALDYLKEDKLHGGKAYFVGQERPVPLWWFINKILVLHGLASIQRSISLDLAVALGVTFETIYKLLKIKKEPSLTHFVALQLGTSHYFNQSAAARDLGYRPQINIEDGLKDLVEV